MPIALAPTPHEVQRQVILWAGGLVVLTALLVLDGWIMGITWVVAIVDGWATMKVNTAICFLLSGIALILFGWSTQQARLMTFNKWLLAAILIVIPVLTMLQDSLGWNDRIDHMLSPMLIAVTPTNFMRMSTATAAGFALAGLAIVLLDGGRRCVWVAQSLASAVFLLAFVSFLVHVLGARGHAAEPFSFMSIHTVFAFGVLSVGLVTVHYDQGWIGEFFGRTESARLGRRYLVSSALALPLIAELTLIGERELKWYGPDFGTVIVTTASVTLLAMVNWIAVRLGNATDHKISNLRRVNATLSGINNLIVRVRDKASLLAGACRIAATEGAFPFAWIATTDPDRAQINLEVWAGEGETRLGGLGLRRSLSYQAGREAAIIGQVIRTKSPVVVNELSEVTPLGTLEQDRVRELLNAGARSFVALPLIVDEVVVGVFVLYAEVPTFFSQSEMRLLEELAGNVSFALLHIDSRANLKHLAFYDPLTKLPNRTLFMERLASQLRDAVQSQSKVALVLGNLQRFGKINETFGRHVGDNLLRQVAQRLIAVTPHPDNLSRTDSDSFAWFLTYTDLARLSNQIDSMFNSAMASPLQFGEQFVTVEFRLAVAIFPSDGNDSETLMINAETAMRNAKMKHSTPMYYEAAMNARVAETLALEHRLRRAVDNGELELHYQPKVDFAERRIRSVEALMRWRDPERGLIPPVQFIPLMEEIGLIRQAGAWALQQALIDLQRWRAMGLQVPRCAINVSAIQLRSDDFVKTVLDAIANAGNEDVLLDIELTETLLMQDLAHIRGVLQTLRDGGVQVAIDDFGTGYSSLSYLARLPINALKIDRAFVVEMEQHAEGISIVSTIISLAHSLKLQVIAEGVETEAQAGILHGLQCDLMQGYLFSKPVPFDVLAAMLSKARMAPSRDWE